LQHQEEPKADRANEVKKKSRKLSFPIRHLSNPMTPEALKGLSLRGILYGELPTDPGPGHEIYRTVQQIVKVRFYEAN